MNKRLLKWTLVPLLVLVAALAVGVRRADRTRTKTVHQTTTVTPQLAAPQQKQVMRVLSETHFSGTCSIFRHGREVMTVARGMADNGAQVPNRQQTMYEIDSIQKMITAALLMQQVTAGKVSLNDRLSRFYPTAPGARHITIRQMLNMTSGLSMTGAVGPTTVMSDRRIIASDLHRVRFNPAMHGKWNYQPVNFNLLAGILEQTSGQQYQTLVQQRVISRLRLKHTVFAYNVASQQLAATGYNSTGKQTALNTYDHPAGRQLAWEHDELGTGQLYMSTGDLYRVTRAILRGQLIPLSAVHQLYRSGSPSTYGAGFYINDRLRSVNGAGYGFEGTLRISANGQNAVILLSNYQIPGMGIKKIADAFNALASIT